MADGGEAAALNPGSRRLLSSTLSPLPLGLVVSGGAGVLKRDVDGDGVRLWRGSGSVRCGSGMVIGPGCFT